MVLVLMLALVLVLVLVVVMVAAATVAAIVSLSRDTAKDCLRVKRGHGALLSCVCVSVGGVPRRAAADQYARLAWLSPLLSL